MTVIQVMLLLFVGGVLAWLSERWHSNWPKWIALITCLLSGVLLLPLYSQEPAIVISLAGAPSNWIEYSQTSWIPRFGISFIFALDGLSLMMVSLTVFLGFVAILSSWTEISDQPGFFQFNLLWTLAGVVGVFTSLDLFLFFFFWEVMLIPMYFLIAIWGHEKRAYAAMKFFIFTQFSGLLMLVAILTLVLVNANQTGQITFNYFELAGHDLGSGLSLIVMLGFFIAFVVKLPAFPVHPWLPDAHTQAPTAASVLLAGILLKTGAYGLIRFTVPLFPEASIEIAELAMLLGAISILYGAVLAFAQTDFKRLVAYSSVSHMGFVLVGVYAFDAIAMQGAVMQMVAHGFSTAALFMMAGAIQHRIHTRDMTQMGGLWQAMPKMGAVALFFIVASLGMPGLGNFIGEFLVLLGAFKVNMTITAIAALGLITGAIYSLIAMQRVFQGSDDHQRELSDLDGREFTALIPLMLGLLWLGVYPQPVFDLVNPVLASIQQVLAGAGSQLIGSMP
ncbi:MAG: NADH-quinone oxidoreductase subunit M [Gammaproteobacteria bacterium]|jgi:NADH-quinone oxidoreductase subunit M|nr:NADH-quinone oxidoreductase subunit M [Gammaproteobacteria bacterium]MBT5202365.1 NADH-quinone oxidoreductase subunit M [Gammaproteobacteria bacterium]MBT5603624.1 NADH-quinone oxidoreductase subunit M [Gammaproteobacteria bacterium]MBT6245769.1 NADH-quinone oxidoreductase subunit M [Gammaproteobacteria bacterium]